MTRVFKAEAIYFLKEDDIGKWVLYTDGFKKEFGKIKAFDNERQVAWVVYHCDNNWGKGWENYTAACTNYSDLTYGTP